MQYLLLIYNTESNWNSLSEAEGAKILQEFGEFTQSIMSSGHLKGANRLHPVSKATTVRVQNGKKLVTDGPFAETKEQLGGYYLIEAKDLDEATAIAARIPAARMGSIEVRPVWEMQRP
ncbi:MAG TPA: YciI family protein [Terracidiphilus sp.]|nr:YciI family protein [Terracidiphilus sp.]